MNEVERLKDEEDMFMNLKKLKNLWLSFKINKVNDTFISLEFKHIILSLVC